MLTQIQMKSGFLLSMLALFLCLNTLFLGNTAAQVDNQAAVATGDSNYTFESIEVPGVDFLELTASSDFEDYAGNTLSADGEKMVGFTLIDGVFNTYDFPGSKNTYFYALGNDGTAAGYYEDSDGLHHGVILENGELRQYDFPGAVQTEIYGISDATGDLTGNWIDASGVRRGFSGDLSLEFPGAVETYADFVNASGVIVGSYIDSAGIYHAYGRLPNGRFVAADILTTSDLDFLFVHGLNDINVIVARSKVVDDVPRTYVGIFGGLEELRFPGSVSTEGWNINQDSSVVGNYVTADGHRHGFIAKPVKEISQHTVAPPIDLDYTFERVDVPGVDFLELTANNDFGDYAGSTRSADGEKMVGFTLIDGVFNTYDFPGSKNTYFYALGNDGTAAGYYEDSDGLHHGVILENGELRRYDFPDAAETFIYGLSDETGALTGSWIDASGVRRGFTGDTIIEGPGAIATYAYSVNTQGEVVGSYVNPEGLYHAFIRSPDNKYTSPPTEKPLEFAFFHQINDAGVYVGRSKAVGDVPRTYVGTLYIGSHELQFPDSVSTHGWNINQDGSVVGYYDTADGHRHGFIARPAAGTGEAVDPGPVAATGDSNYTFESIDVPGVDFLELTASSDFEDYAGNTLSADGEKTVGFTLIDGVFNTYDFPGSKNTYFYALGNDGRAAGHYEDSDGLHHGVILENGELRQYDFPGAVETFIYVISDATGLLTGDFIDDTGVRRGFSGDLVIEFPGAVETYAGFVDANGVVMGSYINAEGLYHVYIRTPDGTMRSIDVPQPVPFEYLYGHGINNAGTYVARAKIVDDIPRTFVGSAIERSGVVELKFPGSVITDGWNINQDGSIVGNYVSADGRTHGFIARPVSQVEAESYSNVYTVALSKGLNMISVPLAPPTPMSAKTLAGLTGATTVITLDTANQQFVGWTPSAPNEGFSIEGGKGYIVNVPESRDFAFVGAPWTDQAEAAASPPAISAEISQEQNVWAFVVSGHLNGKPASEWLASAVENPASEWLASAVENPVFDGYRVIVRNLRTNSTITASVEGDYFAAATADLSRRSVVQAGDVIELHVVGPDGNVESHTVRVNVTPEHLANAVLSVRLDGIGKPEQDLLLQNYPNPFNPETWIPYQLSKDSPVSVSIYDTTGKLVRTLSLGYQSVGFYHSRGRAAYWDGRNRNGELVASGTYFYELSTPSFRQLRRMVIIK